MNSTAGEVKEEKVLPHEDNTNLYILAGVGVAALGVAAIIVARMMKKWSTIILIRKY